MTKIETSPLGANSPDQAANANTNIFSTDISISTQGTLRVIVTVEASAVFGIILTRGGTQTPIACNGGNALLPFIGYIFDQAVLQGDTLNFQVNSNVTVLLLSASLITVTQ